MQDIKRFSSLLKDTRREAEYTELQQAVIKAGQYAYRDRRQKKRQFRSLWITKINAAARMNNLSTVSS